MMCNLSFFKLLSQTITRLIPSVHEMQLFKQIHKLQN